MSGHAFHGNFRGVPVPADAPRPRRETGGDLCGAETPTKYGSFTCTAADGHDGPHAAYAGGARPVATWPQDGAA